MTVTTEASTATEAAVTVTTEASTATEAVSTAEAPTTTEPPAVTGAAATFSAEHLLVGAGARFDSADDPEFVAADQATWVEPDDVVLGVLQGGEAVAFPIDQMSYHHIANTSVAGEPYLVTY